MKLHEIDATKVIRDRKEAHEEEKFRQDQPMNQYHKQRSNKRLVALETNENTENFLLTVRIE